MNLPQYQVKVLTDAYALHERVHRWQSLKYRQELNKVCSATLTLHPDNEAIDGIDIDKWLQIVRNGAHVFGGPIQRYEWSIPQSTPEGEAWTVYALDHMVYANWRIVLPGAGNDYAEYTDHAGDAMKDFVYNNMGSGAAAARRFADLTIEADGHEGTSTTYSGRYETVLAVCQRIANGNDLDFRFVPSATGCTFTVASSWGSDRSQGNGVNAECVFALDRRNFHAMKYIRDALTHRNYIYVGGQDAGQDRTIVERTDAADVSDYGRREAFVDGRNTAVEDELETIGDAALNALEVLSSPVVQPVASTWKAASGTTWDLGDTVTCKVLNRHGRSWDVDAKVVAIDVTVNEAGVETVTPTLERVE